MMSMLPKNELVSIPEHFVERDKQQITLTSNALLERCDTFGYASAPPLHVLIGVFHSAGPSSLVHPIASEP